MSLPLAQRVGEALAPFENAVTAVQGFVRSTVDASQPVANALDGTWLGAPLHAALTDVPIGALTAAVALDVAGREEADAALAVGVAAAVPAAVTGFADWRWLRGPQRRIGAGHALLNTIGLGFHLASLDERRRGRRSRARLLLLAGYGINAFAAHVGGQLSFGFGVRVNHTFPERAPDDWTDAGADDLGTDELRRVEVDGTPVLLARARGELCAISATCTHLGGPLDQGERKDDSVVCPWHGSRFDLCTGAVIDGPAVFDEPRYATRVRDGRIEIKGAS